MQKNTLSSQVHMEHSPGCRLPHLGSHKSSLGKFKKIEIISSIPSDHNTMRLVINCKNITVKKKKHKYMEIKQHILNSKQASYWRNQKENLKTSRNKWQWMHDNSKPMGCGEKNSSKREAHSNTILPQ